MKNYSNLLSVVMLAGGIGSRFSSLNEPPKQLSKLNNKVILMYIIKNFKKYGINHFIFPLGYKSKYFIDFFSSIKNKKKYGFNVLNKNIQKNYQKNKINISFFNAGKNTKKLSRIYKSLKYIIGKDLLVAYTDDLSNINIHKLYKKFLHHKKQKVLITTFKKNSQYGHLVVNKNGRVRQFIEKPIIQNPINIGHYIFTLNILKKYKKLNFELENNMIPFLSKKNLLYTYEHKGYFFSINDKKELLYAEKKLKNIK